MPFYLQILFRALFRNKYNHTDRNSKLFKNWHIEAQLSLNNLWPFLEVFTSCTIHVISISNPFDSLNHDINNFCQKLCVYLQTTVKSFTETYNESEREGQLNIFDPGNLSLMFLN